MTFNRSGYDFADEASIPGTGYQVCRRADQARLQLRLLVDKIISVIVGVVPDLFVDHIMPALLAARGRSGRALGV